MILLETLIYTKGGAVLNISDVKSEIKTKKITDTLGSLIDYTTARTTQINDFTPGSVIRSIYEAVAMTLEEYYIYSAENVLWGIHHGVLDFFGFTPQEALPAHGYITLYMYTPMPRDTTISRGTSFYTDSPNPVVYATQQDYIIPAGASQAQIEVFCTKAGTVGNVPAHSITSISNSITNISSVDNTEAFLTGSDEESDEDQLKRAQAYAETRGRATVKAFEYAARSIDGVAGVYIYEEKGHVSIYAHDANGDLPADMAQKIMTAEESYRGAGVGWDVYPVVKVVQDLDIDISLTSDAYLTDDFLPGLDSYIANYLNSFTVGKNLVLNDIINKVMSYSPFVYDAHITNLDNNVILDPNQIIRSGDVDAELEV